jgi:hypothetical protein
MKKRASSGLNSTHIFGDKTNHNNHTNTNEPISNINNDSNCDKSSFNSSNINKNSLNTGKLSTGNNNIVRINVVFS